MEEASADHAAAYSFRWDVGVSMEVEMTANVATAAANPTQKPPKIEVIAENIPDEIKALNRWVTWDWVWSAKQNKWTKPPLQLNHKLASSTDSKTWTRFDLAWLIGRNRAGIGFVLGSDLGIVGIDLDKCRNPLTGEIKQLQAEIIRELGTYAEVSPSGTGVKMLCRGSLPEKFRKANHELGIEIYADGRYFTITGHTLDGSPKTINDSQDKLTALINRFMHVGELPSPELASQEDETELARSALAAIDPALADGYTDWLMIGMSLHAISPYLLQDWDRWSMQSAKYTQGECQKKWAGFDGQGVGPGTLYHFAKLKGWKPPRGWKKTASQVAAEEYRIANYREEVQQKGDRVIKTRVPIPQRQIVEQTLRVFDGWPKKVQGSLFVCKNAKVEYLPKPHSLFSWMRDQKEIAWGSGDSLATKEEFHSSLMRNTEEFIDIQHHAHFPPIEGIFYTCKQPEPTYGLQLNKFLDFFCPATKEDRQLILAAIATTFWGGPPSQRPVFLISAAPGAGQGTGKSTLAAMIATLTGGSVDISAGMESEEIKRRLLNGADVEKRVVCLDNVKKTKFSDQGIEALITAKEISGHKMFVGGCSRPNLLTWFMTMNGPSLSRDLAQRTINIILKRPKHSGNWYEQVMSHVETYGKEIVSDIAGFFARERQEIDYPTRWGMWEREIVSRLDDPNGVCTTIRSRETINDDDHQTAQAIEELVKYRLTVDVGYLMTDRVHISNERVAAWVNKAVGDDTKGGVRQAIATLTRLENSGLLSCLSKNPSRKYGRGWVFSMVFEDGDIYYDLEKRIIENMGSGWGWS